MKVSVPQLQKNFVVSLGSNLMKSLLEKKIPVASSCQGDGVCGKCRVTVVGSPESLKWQNDMGSYFVEKYQLKPNERLSCQVQIYGDVEIRTGYW